MFSFPSDQIVKKDLGGKLLLSSTCDSVLSNRPTLQPGNNSEKHAGGHSFILCMLQDTNLFFLTMLRQHSQYDRRLGFSFRVLVRVRVRVRLGYVWLRVRVRVSVRVMVLG